MSILFMMPRWHASTEVWLQRMITGLENDISEIIVNDSEGNSAWENRIRVTSLNRPPRKIPLLTRGLKSLLGISLEIDPPDLSKVLTREIKTSHSNGIFCHYGGFAAKFMKVWRGCDLPLFIHFHGYDTTFDLRQFDQPNRLVHPGNYLANIHELETRATLMAGSDFMKSQLVAAGVKPENVIMKRYGVPVNPKPHLHQKTEEILILQVGRFVDFKSPDRTIKAFEIARSRGLKGRLLLVGDGPLRSYCELLRLRSVFSSDIEIRDSVSNQEAVKLYESADIFTMHNIQGELTRQSEGFGVVILEAMASGLPVIGTKSGGVVESVVDGETGFLNEPGDVEAQAESFLKLAADPELRQSMGEAGRTRVAQHFTPEQETARLREIMGLNK